MQYMLLCCFDESRWLALPETERAAIMSRYGDWIQALKQHGQHLASGKLESAATATTVSMRDSRPVLVDGPYAETKEQLGGYHLVDCANLDEALSLALRIPTLPFGGKVEVRPLMEIGL